MNFLQSITRQGGIRIQVMLGAACLLLPLSVLFYFNIEQVSHHIDFAVAEEAGLDLQAPLVSWLATVPAGSTQPVATNPSAGAAAARLGIAEAWSALTANPNPSSEAVRKLITLAADKSNLILDPELDSYYLMEISALVIPQTLDRLNEVRSRLQNSTDSKGSQRLVWLAAQRSMFAESDRDRIVAAATQALAENQKAVRGPRPELSSNLLPAQQRYQQAMESYLNAVDELLAGNHRSARHLALWQEADREAHMSIEAFARAATAELRALLGMRQDYYAQYRNKVVLGTLIALLVSLTLLWRIVNGITQPLRAVVDHLACLAERDLRPDLAPEHLERSDEVGEVARASQALLLSMRNVIGELNRNAVALTAASESLHGNTQTLSSGVEETLSRAQSTAAAAEEMSVNVQSMASSMEETSTNVDHVAIAAGRMNDSIGEIHSRTSEALQRTGEASQQAREIQSQMRKLAEAAQAIGQVTETIQAISAQTNLLALNATIEAARAGAAGKGFAVVANEIKDLAHQTAAATGDIRQRIDGVQHSAGASTEVLERVVDIVNSLEQLATSMAASMEAQAVMTGEITGNMQEAASGAREAKLRLSESSTVSLEIARDASGVNQVAQSLSEANLSVRTESQRLAAMAQQLTETVACFTLPVEAHR